MTQLTGIRYKGRTVRCNAEDDKAGAQSHQAEHGRRSQRGREEGQGSQRPQRQYKKEDWRSLMQNTPRVDFKGEEPDFSEEGWARRKPKKK